MEFLQNFPDQTSCLCHNEHLAVTTSVCSKRKVIAQTIIRMVGNIFKMGMQEENIQSFLLRILCWKETFLLLRKYPKHTPVIKVANKEKRFPVFADVHSGVNLPDVGRQAKLIDCANVQPKPLQHQVPLTWNNRVVSQARKHATKHRRTHGELQQLSCAGL